RRSIPGGRILAGSRRASGENEGASLRGDLSTPAASAQDDGGKDIGSERRSIASPFENTQGRLRPLGFAPQTPVGITRGAISQKRRWTLPMRAPSPRRSETSVDL